MTRWPGAALAAIALLAAVAGPAPAATVVLVPGSGFRGTDRYDGARLSIRPAIWRTWGLHTRVAAYGPGRVGPADVLAAVDAARRAAPGRRLCLYGESSGGTWALLAAARARGVSCVIVAAAPTDEESWRRATSHAARVLSRRVWPAFFGGRRHDNPFEPLDVWRAARPRVAVLYLAAAGDPAVPVQQGRILGRLGARIRVRVLHRGRHPFVHSRVSARDFSGALRAVRRLARSGAGR